MRSLGAVRSLSVYRWWYVVLILYVLMPWSLDDNARIPGIGLPIEYAPLLAVLSFAALVGSANPIQSGIAGSSAVLWCATTTVAYIVLSSLWSVNIGSWLKYAGMWAVYVSLLVTVIRNISAAPSDRVTAFLHSLSGWVAIYLVAIFVRFVLYPSEQYSWSQHLDFTPVIRYRIVEVWTVLPFVPLSIVLYERSGLTRHLLVVVLGSWAIVLSFSRTGLIGLATAVALTVAFAVRRRLAAALAVGAVSAVGMIIAFTVTHGAFADRVESIGIVNDMWFGEPAPREAAWGRHALITESLRIFREHPWLGTGAGNYTEYFDRSLPLLPMNPHNFYLSYLAELGVVGFAPLIALVLAITLFLWRAARRVQDRQERSIVVALAAVQTSLLVMFAATDFLIAPHLWFAWGLSIGVAGSIVRKPTIGELNVARRRLRVHRLAEPFVVGRGLAQLPQVRVTDASTRP